MTDNVMQLTGTLAPVTDEIDAADLPVTGTLPRELTGRYLRNGPNPLPHEPPGHWFTGHGMLHGVRLRDGRASWYRNRWIRTAQLAGEPFISERGVNLAANSANTHIVAHGGKLLALCEAGFPYEVTVELETLGPHTFDDRLKTAMTAHPKTDPMTGELFFFGYSPMPPFVTFHIADATGQLVHSEPIDVPAATMMHDFAITANHVVWLDLPVTFEMSALGAGQMPFVWNDRYSARLGVMPKHGGAVRWFEIDPCYVFHVGNAFEDDDGRLVLDAVRYSPKAFAQTWPTIGGKATAIEVAAAAAEVSVSVLHRWVLDLRTGAVTETALDDQEVEFPTLHEGLVGRPNRYLYTVSSDSEGRIVKYDTGSGTSEQISLGDCRVGEATFVPATDGEGEDEGWLLTITTPRDGGASELLVLDATALTDGPLARVGLPRRVPAGFHGSWFHDSSSGDKA